MEINGAQMFVKALQEEHVDTLFAYPGGTAINLFDALYDAEGIDMILPRHEQALVHAADGYARSTGKVGNYFNIHHLLFVCLTDRDDRQSDKDHDRDEEGYHTCNDVIWKWYDEPAPFCYLACHSHRSSKPSEEVGNNACHNSIPHHRHRDPATKNTGKDKS